MSEFRFSHSLNVYPEGWSVTMSVLGFNKEYACNATDKDVKDAVSGLSPHDRNVLDRVICMFAVRNHGMLVDPNKAPVIDLYEKNSKALLLAYMAKDETEDPLDWANRFLNKVPTETVAVHRKRESPYIDIYGVEQTEDVWVCPVLTTHPSYILDLVDGESLEDRQEWKRQEEARRRDWMRFHDVAGISTAFKIAKVGLRARNDFSLPVKKRLRLCRVFTNLAYTPLMATDYVQMPAELAELLKDVLNVTEVSLEPAEHSFACVQYEVIPNFQLVGKRLGKRNPEFKKYLNGITVTQDVLDRINRGQFEWGGEMFTREEVKVVGNPKKGFVSAGDGEFVVVLDTTESPDLAKSTRSREIRAALQKMRKALNLHFSDRVDVWVESPSVAEELKEDEDFLQAVRASSMITTPTELRASTPYGFVGLRQVE